VIVSVLNGPNLGLREPEIYGAATYLDLVAACYETAAELGIQVEVHQTDAEHELLAWLHQAADQGRPVVLNAAAWTHYSIAVRDACAQLTAPFVEVHLSNVFQRERFRQVSLLAPLARGVISGLGLAGYRLALRYLAEAVGSEVSDGGARAEARGDASALAE
jgi:3-dehydroquinate dehydratase-2